MDIMRGWKTVETVQSSLACLNDSSQVALFEISIEGIAYLEKLA